MSILLRGSIAFSATSFVEMRNFSFLPNPVTVNQGDTIRWRNTSGSTHTSTSGNPCTPNSIWDTGNVTSGDTSIPVAFPTVGSFPYFCIPHCPSMAGQVIVQGVGVEERGGLPPTGISHSSINPNPFQGSAVIHYSLPKETHVKIEVFDLSGRRVRTLRNSVEESGEKGVEWNGRDDGYQRLNSGIYFIRIETSRFQSVMKTTLLR